MALSSSVRCLAVVLLLSLCVETCPSAASEVLRENGITYQTVGDRPLQVDLARPDGDGPFPGIVFVHGGGWRNGNRGRWTRELDEAAKRGFVAISVTYRLTEPDKQGRAKHPFPTAIHDVKCAVRWLRANATKYHLDPKRIGACGGSAGGHLSLLLGLTDGKSGLEGDGGYPDRPSKVQAVVNWYGPTDMAVLHKSSRGAAPILASFLAGSPDTAADRYRKSSPVTWVSKDDGPVLTIHGAVDTLVPPEQAHLLDAAMKKAGASHTLLLLEGQPHGFRGDAGVKAREATFEFFEKHLKSVASGDGK